MNRFSVKALSVAIVSVVVSVVLSGAVAFASVKASPKAAGALTPKVQHSVKSGKSPALRDIHAPSRPPSGQKHALPNHTRTPLSAPRSHDGAVQRQSSPSQPTPQLNFAGSSAADDSVADLGAVSPASAVMDVGAGHIVQTVNSVMQVWDTAGNQEMEPIAPTSLFAGLGGQCGGGGFNAVDTVIRYDELAGRWVLAFVPYDFQFVAPFDLCVAVSTSSDPTGTWSTYAYEFPNLLTNPRLGVWPDGYYMAFDQLDGSFNFTGVMSLAFDRTAMIAGAESATAIQFASNSFFSLVPADLDGGALPAEGAPNPQASPGEAAWDGSPNPVIHMFQFHADFGTPENSTFDGPFDVSVPDFNPVICGGGFVPCIPALNGTSLFAQAGMLLNGMQYRNLGDHESLVVSQTVNVSDGGDQAGVRWYEIRTNPTAGGGASPFSLFQSGSYAPTATNRWMSSIAMDVSGDIAMGYSISDATIHPEIGLTGRLSTDPLGSMGSEIIMTAGQGSQQAPNWGNYTGMVVDPADGCTFWYTNMYYDTDANDGFEWLSRIGSFRFPSCTSGPSGTLQGTVTDGTNPIAGATVTAGASSTTTNAGGAYAFTLPVGAYDMVASKFGFLASSAAGVSVTADNTTVQDFVLTPAPSTLVNGTVKDGSGAGWPLAANITITAPGAPTLNTTADPATGYYEITLVEGLVYTFKITSPVPGYLQGGGPLDLSATARIASSVVKNWQLFADAATCNAPGYTQSFQGLSEAFDAGVIPKGWTVINNGSGGNGNYPIDWQVNEGPAPCGDFGGNMTGGDGPYAVVNTDCPGSTVFADTQLITSSVNMSSFSAATLRFNEDYRNLADNADVDVSVDGGTTWTNVLAQSSSARGPLVINVDITSVAAGHSNVQARFHYYNAFFAWWWQVDNVLLGQLSCLPGTGGLVVGNVTSLATGAGLNGADVAVDGGGSVKTFAGNGDGFYALFAPAGNQSFEASLKLYGTVDHDALVVPNGTTVLNFALPSGKLTAGPTAFNIRLAPNGTLDQTLVLTNSGSVDAAFSLRELNVPLVPPPAATGPFVDAAQVRQALSRLPATYPKQVRAGGVFSLAKFGPLPNATDVASVPTTAGDVIANYPATFASPNGLPFGVLLDNGTGNFYVSNLGSGFPGDNMDHEFLGDGTETGQVIDMSSLGFLPVDGTYNNQSGMFWQATNDFFGGSNTCIYEIDPSSRALTGNTICPAFPVPQTGLAYDLTTNTYYSGSFFDNSIQHFDSDGVILDSASVGLAVTGLAYNAGTGHLFVFQQTGAGAGNDDVYILDPANGYAVLGSFLVGAPGINSAASGGMEMDCDGHLVLVDQLGVNPIFVVDSGETNGSCHFVDTIPWVSEDPTDGTVAANSANGGSIAVHFDATGLLPGLRQAQFTFGTDTPNKVPPMPVTLTVQFLDVPDNNQFQAFIYGAAGAGVMIGGPPNCPAGVLYFCPAGFVTRADMAGYLFRAVHGASTPPPVYQNAFQDVTFNQYNSFYIQGVFDDGIAAGCSSSPALYCPDIPVTRAQMSALVWKGMFGDQAPPACSGLFKDVPCPSLFADYIEALAGLGITAGCGNGDFCPHDPITNGQMATFLVKAFNLPYLP